ncbi:hypothetical protein LguiB_023979 [Lonicera macranthoides]
MEKVCGERLLPRMPLAKASGSNPPAFPPKFVHVDNFGAKGDGSDDSQAFNRAWKEACSSKGGVIFVVPRNKVYLLKPVTFSGPCQSRITFKIYGKIKASTQISDYKNDQRHWIVFENIQNLEVDGGGSGTIDGRGRIWWQNSCKIDESKALTFSDCNNLGVSRLRIENAQQMHLTFENCVNVRASLLTVISPANSPNTDGIHITSTQNIQIFNSLVGTGDDCVSIVSGSRNVRITDITCGPGHGISIGSLGKNKSEDEVSNVIVDRAKISGTTNGLRIKSWQGGSGYAKNIMFKNVMMHNVTNPIIIDQNYCDQKESCPEQYSAVQVENIVYKNIKGSSASEVAIKFDCSDSFPCKGILVQDVNLYHLQKGHTDTSGSGRSGQQDVEASCSSVWLTTKGRVSPLCS